MPFPFKSNSEIEAISTLSEADEALAAIAAASEASTKLVRTLIDECIDLLGEMNYPIMTTWLEGVVDTRKTDTEPFQDSSSETHTLRVTELFESGSIKFVGNMMRYPVEPPQTNSGNEHEVSFGPSNLSSVMPSEAKELSATFVPDEIDILRDTEAWKKLEDWQRRAMVLRMALIVRTWVVWPYYARQGRILVTSRSSALNGASILADDGYVRMKTYDAHKSWTRVRGDAPLSSEEFDQIVELFDSLDTLAKILGGIFGERATFETRYEAAALTVPSSTLSLIQQFEGVSTRYGQLLQSSGNTKSIHGALVVVGNSRNSSVGVVVGGRGKTVHILEIPCDAMLPVMTKMPFKDSYLRGGGTSGRAYHHLRDGALIGWERIVLGKVDTFAASAAKEYYLRMRHVLGQLVPRSYNIMKNDISVLTPVSKSGDNRSMIEDMARLVKEAETKVRDEKKAAIEWIEKGGPNAVAMVNAWDEGREEFRKFSEDAIDRAAKGERPAGKMNWLRISGAKLIAKIMELEENKATLDLDEVHEFFRMIEREYIHQTRGFSEPGSELVALAAEAPEDMPAHYRGHDVLERMVSATIVSDPGEILKTMKLV